MLYENILKQESLNFGCKKKYQTKIGTKRTPHAQKG